MKRIRFAITGIILAMTLTAAEMPLVVFGEEGQEAVEEKEEKKSKSSEKSKSKEKSSSSDKNAEINKEIEANQNAISEAEAEKSQIKNNISNVQQIINGLEKQKGNLENYVKELDSALGGIQREITTLNDKIEQLDDKLSEVEDKIEAKEKEINDTEKELAEAKETLNTQYQDTKQHIRYMYETRTSTLVDILFTADGIQDLLNRAEYVCGIAKYDESKIKEYAKAQEAVENKQEELNNQRQELGELKEQIEATKEEISGQKDEVTAKENDMNKLISAKEQEIDVYEADISNKEAQIKEYQDMIAAQDAVIKSLESAIAAQRARLQAEAEENGEEPAGLPKYDGGKFAFPAPSYTRVSDDYGNRIHPTLKVQQFHNGIDLAAPSGSPILAAYDGTVIAADYSATMGNYIMIDHGDSVFTIYMHASSLLVSKNATVTKGQKIALVGSTGRSTGPHLHFSVRVNGSYVSPWNYVK